MFVSCTIKQVDTLATDGWAVTFGTARRSLLLAVPNVIVHLVNVGLHVTVMTFYLSVRSSVACEIC